MRAPVAVAGTTGVGRRGSCSGGRSACLRSRDARLRLAGPTAGGEKEPSGENRPSHPAILASAKPFLRLRQLGAPRTFGAEASQVIAQAKADAPARVSERSAQLGLLSTERVEGPSEIAQLRATQGARSENTRRI